MSYNAPATVVTGDLITAVKWNADVSANPIALYAGALAISGAAQYGIPYFSTTTQQGAVAPGATGTVLKGNTGAAPSFGVFATAAAAPYTPTLTNLINSTTETEILRFTVPANDWSDGDFITIAWLALVKNNSGGPVVVTSKVNVGAGAQVSVLTGSGTWNDSATEGVQYGAVATLIRVGSSVYVASVYFWDANAPTQPAHVATAPGTSNPADFTSDITVQLKHKFDTAHASVYIKPQLARIWRQHN